MTDLSLPRREKVLEVIVLHLSKLQGLARGIDETFVAFAISSAQRQAALRCEELLSEIESDLPLRISSTEI